MNERMKRVLNQIQYNVEVIPDLEKAIIELREILLAAKCASLEVETKLKVLDEELGHRQDRNPIETIKTRIKDVESIINKLERKGLLFDRKVVEENINDIAGIRVVCSYTDDIYEIANMLTSQDDVRLIESKDYIINPKPNGYRSLHLIIEVPVFFSNETKWMRVEVQIRTIAMDFWASLEHTLKYKKNGVSKEVIEELKCCANNIAESDAKMLELRNKINKTQEHSNEK